MTRPRHSRPRNKGLTEVRKTILSPDDPQEQGCEGPTRSGSGSAAQPAARPKKRPASQKKEGTYMEERVSRYAG